MGADLSITAKQFETIVNEGVEVEASWREGEKYTLDSSDFWDEANGYKEVDFGEFGKAKHIDGEHGGEGSAEHIWQVWQIGDQYFMKTGYYQSYDGSYWDGDLVEVEPFEKTVTDWRDKV